MVINYRWYVRSYSLFWLDNILNGLFNSYIYSLMFIKTESYAMYVCKANWEQTKKKIKLKEVLNTKCRSASKMKFTWFFFYNLISNWKRVSSFGSLFWDFLWYLLRLLLFSTGHSICRILQFYEVDFIGRNSAFAKSFLLKRYYALKNRMEQE